MNKTLRNVTAAILVLCVLAATPPSNNRTVTVDPSGNLVAPVNFFSANTTFLPASGVVAGSYGDGSHVATFQVDVKGRITSAAAVSVSTSSGTLSGPLIRPRTHDVQILNWSTLNAADFSTNKDFTVTFSGSPSSSQHMSYGVTNSAATNITVTVPTSYSLADRGMTTSVLLKAASYSDLRWEFDGTLYKLGVEAPDNATIAAFANNSGYFYAEGATVDDVETTVATIWILDNYTSAISADFSAGSRVNSAGFKRFAAFKRAGATVTQIGSTADLATVRNVGTWVPALKVSGTNIIATVVGDAIEPVNWTIQGLATARTNGLTTCSVVRDSVSGLTQGNFATSQYYWQATKFTAAANYTACSATLRLSKTGSPSGNVTVEIWSHNSMTDIPNAIVGTGSDTVAVSTITGSEGDVLFPGMHAAITSGTIYWVVLKGNVGDDGSNFVTWHWYFLGGGTHGTMGSDNSGVGWNAASEQSQSKFTLKSN